jgi:MFS family permease
MRSSHGGRLGGLLLCLVNAGLMFGLFLLCSLYLQLALGHGPLSTGLAFIPLALAAGIGAHVAGHLLSRHGLRWAAGPALALAAGGLLLLSHIPAHGSYLRDMLPGMLMAGFGLGLSGTAMAVGVLTGARHDEAGMVSGASATTHEIGGTLGIAIDASIATAAAGDIFVGPAAAAGIAHAFLIAGYAASAPASPRSPCSLPRRRSCRNCASRQRCRCTNNQPLRRLRPRKCGASNVLKEQAASSRVTPMTMTARRPTRSANAPFGIDARVSITPLAGSKFRLQRVMFAP